MLIASLSNKLRGAFMVPVGFFFAHKLLHSNGSDMVQFDNKTLSEGKCKTFSVVVTIYCKYKAL